MIIEIPENTSVETILLSDLNSTWRNPNDYSGCQPVGDKLYNERKSLTLKVPSAVMPEAHNFVINALHADFNKVILAGVTNLVPDERIEEILKKYPGN